MKGRFYILWLLLAVIMLTAVPADAIASSYTGQEQGCERDRLYDGGLQDHDKHTSTVNDAVMPVRTCIHRVVRLNPSFGPSPSTSLSRGQCPVFGLGIPVVFILRNLESTPFRTAVSRFYYIIALRHILC